MISDLSQKNKRVGLRFRTGIYVEFVKNNDLIKWLVKISVERKRNCNENLESGIERGLNKEFSWIIDEIYRALQTTLEVQKTQRPKRWEYKN